MNIRWEMATGRGGDEGGRGEKIVTELKAQLSLKYKIKSIKLLLYTWF